MKIKILQGLIYLKIIGKSKDNLCNFVKMETVSNVKIDGIKYNLLVKGEFEIKKDILLKILLMEDSIILINGNHKIECKNGRIISNYKDENYEIYKFHKNVLISREKNRFVIILITKKC